MSLQLLDATGVCNDADTDATLFGIEVSLDVGTGESPLLSAASVLHRRGIDVIEASLVMRSTRRFRFTATFRCDAAQARTVLRHVRESHRHPRCDPDRPQRWAAAQLTGSCRCVLSGLESPAGNVFDHEMLCYQMWVISISRRDERLTTFIK